MACQKEEIHNTLHNRMGKVNFKLFAMHDISSKVSHDDRVGIPINRTICYVSNTHGTLQSILASFASFKMQIRFLFRFL